MIKIQFVIKNDDVLDDSLIKDPSFREVSATLHWIELVRKDLLDINFKPELEIKENNDAE